MEVPVVTTEPTSSGPSATTILLLAKVGSMIVLGLGSLILGMLPLIIGRCRVKKSENRRAITSVSSASTTLTSASTINVHSHDSTQVYNDLFRHINHFFNRPIADVYILCTLSRRLFFFFFFIVIELWATALRYRIYIRKEVTRLLQKSRTKK